MTQETQRTTLPIVQMAKDNDEFRQVIWTGEQSQLVLMAIPQGGEIGGEVHEGHDQLLYFVEGEGEATIGEVKVAVQAGDVSIVPSGVFHNFKNIGSGMLKLYTTYSPPEHAPGTEHVTKREADAE
ncbi:cupin domain-containing protein [Halomonas saccharevitans]|uniref:Cupin domain-containing protein n=1 Tax=Halomonas saccharevitans TaxID=416872 RepID=A0ABU3ND45_9GAMM|nr:cupin domain-containing protein [Halomonas saccharevitans]MDT8878942.1 cupin domain-containing protein [Halomonas saccharevitans]